MLKLYARNLFGEHPRYPVILFPFWGKHSENPLKPATGRFDEYVRVGASYFQLTSLEEADLAILPGMWDDIVRDKRWVATAREFAREVATAGKPLVVFFVSDSFRRVAIDDAIVFRTSFYRSRRTCRDFAVPAWSEDIVTRYLDGELPIRQKGPRPIVGFVGWTGHLGPRDPRAATRLPLKQRLKIPGKWIAHKLGVERFDRTRAVALERLRRSRDVQTNFLYRDTYLGSPMMVRYVKDRARIELIRREFVENLVQSDYVLCCRGAGNYSFRLYETLCAGRIPVFVDTDAPLPYDFAVNWRQYCVWVDRSELPYIGEKVADFHSRISPGDFVDLQRACREFWLEKISPQGFFANFHRHFQPPGLDIYPSQPEVKAVGSALG